MEANQIYWDMRLPRRVLETVEIRVCDVCSSIDEAVMLAGLCALVRTCHKGAEKRRSRTRGAPRDPARRTGSPRATGWAPIS